MATAVAALLAEVKSLTKGVYFQEWTATVSGVGNPLHAAHLPDKTVYIGAVTTGSGTSRVYVEGTNGAAASTATWATLTTPTDGLIDFTGVSTPSIKIIRENPRMIRPVFLTVTTGETMSVGIICR